MKNILYLSLSIFIYSSCVGARCTEVDVLVVGGGASGVTAGIQSARMGAQTLVIELPGLEGC